MTNRAYLDTIKIYRNYSQRSRKCADLIQETHHHAMVTGHHRRARRPITGHRPRLALCPTPARHHEVAAPAAESYA